MRCWTVCFRTSPSLRGSGLKSLKQWSTSLILSLPLYEGVDWNFCQTPVQSKSLWSPSLRGSGLKFSNKVIVKKGLTVSLFTREWIEIRVPRTHPQSLQVSLFTREWIEIGSLLAWIGTIWVSLFTREWIEICKKEIAFVPNGCLPLYEGVDWNRSTSRTCRGSGASPSLRGSGLKFRQ